ncbi:hypothetical protein [Chiayiivirga flava]|uniref:Putative membrane protein n=1 Tax=Chiayiivirga flava TaxID=659595 RepID=A0A7W8D5P1_9GAMM|nr:hypothetical protein [Chiayiivirga flava]MBB5208394.1 putative membrane protein [Chiayiivirga flava]
MRRILVVCVWSCLTVLPLRAAEVTLEELASPPFAGTAGVSNIAADGTVVGTGWPDAMVVRWQPGQPPENLGGDTFTLENILPLISADGGTIAANVYVPVEPGNPKAGLVGKAALWQGETTWAPIDGAVLAQATPFGLSDDGRFLVGAGWVDVFPDEDAVEHAWIWSAETGQQLLGAVDGLSWAQAWAVSNDGTVAVGFADAAPDDFTRHGVRWDAGVAQRIRDAQDRPVGQAIACNSDCSIIVGAGFTAAGGSGQAWRWTAAGGVQFLGEIPGAPPDITYYAFDLTEDGAMIVGSYPVFDPVQGSINHGFVWSEASGLVDIVDFLAAHGIDYGADFNELVVNAITRDGSKLLLNGGNADYQRQRAIVHIAQAPPQVFADGFESQLP